jgi:S-adenosylmethionine/arginine decarboxylase-like enzyme
MELGGNFGQHLVIDFKIDDLNKLNDKEFLIMWVRTLVSDLNMNIHSIDGKDAIMMDTWGSETERPEIHGTSCGVVLITTSSITFHTVVDTYDKNKGIIYLDIFSCKHFTREIVQKNIDIHFNKPEVIRWQLLER